MANTTVSLRVICVNPPPGLFGLQAKDGEIAEGESFADGRSAFSLALQVKQTDAGQPHFTGQYAHGSVQERFLYLTLGEHEGSARRIVKRIKVHLKTITWAQVESCAGPIRCVSGSRGRWARRSQCAPAGGWVDCANGIRVGQ